VISIAEGKPSECRRGAQERKSVSFFFLYDDLRVVERGSLGG
jgi:hypothetical protein